MIVSLGVLCKDCSESKLSPQPLLSSTVPKALYWKLTKLLADNEIGEIKGNSSLKKMGLLIEWIYWIG